MRQRVLMCLAVAVGLVASACGGGDDGGSNDNGGGGSLTGSVVVSGSSTVLPISTAVAEEFKAENPDISITVDGPGTGDGFELFCKGQTDINDASRPMEDDEMDACRKGGVTNYVELEIGLDGITVMTNPANDAVSCLNKGDLYALFGPESQGFGKWSDADALANEVDGTDHFPDVPLDITAPGEESGTYDAFIELALKDIADERGQPDDQLQPDYQSSPNDNVIIEGIEGSESSLGFVGFAYAQNAGSGVKEIEIDGGDGCVAPTAETVADGSYPLSRSLYIYVNMDKARTNKALQGFVDLYLSDIGIVESVQAAGYVDLPQDRIDATRAIWDEVKP